MILVGGHRRKEQVPDQRQQRPEQPGQRPVPVCPAECEQSALPHHAGQDHQGAQHEAPRDPRYD